MIFERGEAERGAALGGIGEDGDGERPGFVESEFLALADGGFVGGECGEEGPIGAGNDFLEDGGGLCGGFGAVAVSEGDGDGGGEDGR